MLAGVFVSFVVLGGAVATRNWRHGLFMFLLVGALQDPVRKLTPGTPVLFVLSGLPIWMGAFLGGLGLGDIRLASFAEESPRLAAATKIFLLSLL